MKSKKGGIGAPLLASLGALFVVLLLGTGFLMSSGLLGRSDSVIELPSNTSVPQTAEPEQQILTAQAVTEVEITPKNVKKVIDSMVRPQAYSCHIENRLFYSGGAGSLYCNRYVRDNVVRTDEVNASGTIVHSLLRRENTVYAWANGDNTYYSGMAGSFSDDAAAMLPTYEDVLQDGVIPLDAGKKRQNTEVCIFVVFEENGYRCEYSISTVSGLLMNAAFYSGDTLVREVTVSSLSQEVPDPTLFSLPGGISLLED